MADLHSKERLLIAAARDGNEDMVRELINAGACVNATVENGKTALIYAVEYGNAILRGRSFHLFPMTTITSLVRATRIIIRLIRGDADVNIRDKNGQSALMYALNSRGYEDMALAIIEVGAKLSLSKDLVLNITDNENQTALMKASFCGMTKVTLALLQRGADVNKKDNKGKTALMHAIDVGKQDIALAIIEHSKELDLNITDNENQTALMNAIFRGMSNVTLALLQRGADVNKKDNSLVKTALIFAIDVGKQDIALSIIEHSKDLDLNITDNGNQAALMKAIFRGMSNVTLALLQLGADVNKKDNKGKTALMYAIDVGNEYIALAIIEHSKELDLQITDNGNQTALMKAILRGMTKVSLELIKIGADVNMRDKDGKTALMFIGLADEKLSGFDAGKLTLALIAADADATMTDHKGNAALMFNVKYEASVKALIEKDQSLVDLKNKSGKTALFYAFIESISTARYLVKNGADLRLTDGYNVSIISYFIHHCINNGLPSVEIWDEKLAFLKDNGIMKETVVNAITNALFCKWPIVTISSDVIFVNAVQSLLSYTATLTKKKSFISRMIGHSQNRLFEDLVRIAGNASNITTALGKLLDFGADPNTSDEQGNTISHHITLMGLKGIRNGTKIALHIFRWLEDKGSKFNQKNCNDESPLFYLLSRAASCHEGMLDIEYISSICEYLVQKDRTIVEDITSSSESLYHLVMKISHLVRPQDEGYMIELLQMFSHKSIKVEATVNKTDHGMNTPLHIWASTPSKPKLSLKILKHLLDCGAKLYLKNMKGQTALHLCTTWTAVKLLVEAGASTKDVDDVGRSPLLYAAQNSLFLKNPGCFYPDVSPSELPTFWKTVEDMGFDLWTYDKNGDSIISNLIRNNSLELADSLIKIACAKSKNLSDEIVVSVLNDICKDESTQTNRKSDLVEKFLNSLRRQLDVSIPLRSCCINYRKTSYGATKSDSVHYQIAKQLLIYCSDSAESCRDVAQGCPPLERLLWTPIPIDDVPMVIPWKSFSKTHENMLAEVARRQNCEFQDLYWYHRKPIGSGGFGDVFVGIHEEDGMEVAIKKIDNSRKNRSEDLREIRTFASLPKCEHIVRYLTFLSTTAFSYIVMELMEGNLDEYLTSPTYDRSKTQILCRDVTLGLKYLHEQNIIHRDIKPTNILYKTNPQLCLKISDFGLSRCLDSAASFTVMATGVGTRGWIAPEVIKSTTHEYFMSSDIFSLGLVLHYTLSDERYHPFSPAETKGMSNLQINHKTESNVLENKMEGWDKVLNPEASDLILEMLRPDESDRPPASKLLEHPMYWSKKKKLEFLSAVGNQGEFECPRDKRTVPLTMVEQDLENEFPAIVKFGSWGDPRYTQTVAILNEMKKPITRPDGTIQKVRKNYDSGSVVELVRFIRNAITHVSESSRPPSIRKEILEDAVFLGEFPKLVLEVFKTVTKHGWDVSREEIKQVFAND